MDRRSLFLHLVLLRALEDGHVLLLGLRHEEFEKGCEAACNGPYDGKYEIPIFKSLTTFKASVLTLFFASLGGVKLWLATDQKMITS